jgi:DNA-binding transcriptional ArsR family regulator
MNPFEAEAHFFKLLMHPARLEILDELRKDEACVCHLEAKLGYRQAYISQHLMVLREAGVIQDRRDGWNIYYHVTKPEIFQIMDAVSQLMGADEKARRAARAPQVPCPCPKCNPGMAPQPCSKELAARRSTREAIS